MGRMKSGDSKSFQAPCDTFFCRELGETVNEDELSAAVENVFKFELALAMVRVTQKSCIRVKNQF